MTPTTYITNSGLVTAVGIGTTAACAAMRAGIDGFAEIPYYDYCRSTVPVIGAPVPPIPWKRSAAARQCALLDAAVGEIAEQFDPATRANLAMIVTTCESERNVVDERRAQSLTETAVAALGQGPAPVSVQALRGGAPASFRALALAR
ncbi:MAG: hypothetical protein HC927_05880, partial [Deltaproteobacteria bacterium]|nr:hypothetical protein [Deltaproteobacteria bacterium]